MYSERIFYSLPPKIDYFFRVLRDDTFFIVWKNYFLAIASKKQSFGQLSIIELFSIIQHPLINNLMKRRSFSIPPQQK